MLVAPVSPCNVGRVRQGPDALGQRSSACWDREGKVAVGQISCVSPDIRGGAAMGGLIALALVLRSAPSRMMR